MKCPFNINTISKCKYRAYGGTLSPCFYKGMPDSEDTETCNSEDVMDHLFSVFLENQPKEWFWNNLKEGI
jgi:hypothetical protein